MASVLSFVMPSDDADSHDLFCKDCWEECGTDTSVYHMPSGSSQESAILSPREVVNAKELEFHEALEKALEAVRWHYFDEVLK